MSRVPPVTSAVSFSLVDVMVNVLLWGGVLPGGAL
jgi:hypothetical protein